MKIKKTIKCPICGMNYIEEMYESCPKCSGAKTGFTRDLFTTNYETPSQNTSTPIKSSRNFKNAVCGWLICTEGPGMGKYFKITNCKNSIGNGNENHIVLDFDDDIDKKECGIIMFDDILNCFWIFNGSGSNCIRLNNDLIVSPIQLKKGDILHIGNTELTFLPLYNENFIWHSLE